MSDTLDIRSTKEDGIVINRMRGKNEAVFNVIPPFPRAINIELNNVCNHSCEFCAYTIMERAKGSIDNEKLEKWLIEAYELGARDIGLHSGAEPFASKYLEYFVKKTKEIGYEYVYISTNCSLATPKRMKAIIDAGIDSIKFSINAGDKDAYRTVHGKDDFDRVISNLKYAAKYRKKNKKPYLAISFVITENNKHTVDTLREMTKNWVDEFLEFPAANQSGQLGGDGSRAKDQNNICPLPFNKLHISREGFLRVCCNDYENMLAIEDLNMISVKEAFYSTNFQRLRKNHLDDNLEGTLCYNCKYDRDTPIQPLDSDLYFSTHDSDKGPAISFTDTIFKTKSG